MKKPTYAEFLVWLIDVSIAWLIGFASGWFVFVEVLK